MMKHRPNARSRAVEAFTEVFGARPRWIARAPGRVNIIGEHIDYAGGLVLPFAIDRDCVVAAGPASGASCLVVAVDRGETWTWDPRRSLVRMREEGVLAVGSWPSYVAGALHRASALAGPLVPIDMTIASDVPIGAGLSSSAALEVSVALVALAAAGRAQAVDPLELARACRDAEHEFAGVPCGLMDQAASVLSREGHALLLDCREPVGWSHVPLPPDVAWLVFDTGVKHDLAAGAYARLRAASDGAARSISVAWLANAQSDADVGRLRPDERRAFDHVTSETRRTREAAAALAAADVQGLGRALDESHASLRDRLGVSCAELDLVVNAVRQLDGVIGARLTGAGFGGCVLVAVRSGAALPDVGAAVTEAFAARFGRPCRVLAVRPSAGAGVDPA